MAYIRSRYRVPAKRGARVRLGEGILGWVARGTVVSAVGQYLRVRVLTRNLDVLVGIVHPSGELCGRAGGQR